MSLTDQFALENRVVQIDGSSNLEKEQGVTWEVLPDIAVHLVSLLDALMLAHEMKPLSLVN